MKISIETFTSDGGSIDTLVNVKHAKLLSKSDSKKLKEVFSEIVDKFTDQSILSR